jgi:hypothetical protein
MMMKDDECEAVGEILGKGAEVLEENLPNDAFNHHKYHIT